MATDADKHSPSARLSSVHRLLWISLQCIVLVHGHPHEHDVEVGLERESHVLEHVLDAHHYAPHLPPAASANDSVLLDLDLALTALHALDMSSGLLESTVRLFMKWKDPRLKWNTTDFEGLSELSVPVARLWTPDLNMFTTSHGSYRLINGKHALMHHEGYVTWLCDVIVRSPCPVDLSNFPFDLQTCHVSLRDEKELDQPIHLHFAQSPPGSKMDSSKGHVDISTLGEWTLMGEEVRTWGSHHGVEIVVRLARRSSLYQCLVVGPVVLLAMLVPVVFLLPAHSQAKITLGGLLQVSICICLRTLCDMLHHHHGSVPSIAIFSVASLALTSISMVMAAFVMSLASTGYSAKPVPAWLSTAILGRCGLRRWLCMDQYLPADRHPPFASLKNGNDVMEADADAASLKGSDSSEARELTRCLRAALGRHSADCRVAEQGSGEWRHIARVLDRLLFLVFVILFMLVSVSLLG